MARRCLACTNPRAAEIDERLRAPGRPSFAKLALELGIGEDALERHAARHLTESGLGRRARVQVEAPKPRGVPPDAHASPRSVARDAVGVEEAAGARVQERIGDKARARRRRSATSPDAKQQFLDAYARCGNVTQAAGEAGIGRSTIYTWQEHDEPFSLAMQQAEQEAIERLEQEARERATNGAKITRKIFRNGVLIEVVEETRPSDMMLIKLLSALRPDKYRERFDIAATSEQVVRVVSGFDPSEVI